jgi:hypothetical protein
MARFLFGSSYGSIRRSLANPDAVCLHNYEPTRQIPSRELRDGASQPVCDGLFCRRVKTQSNDTSREFWRKPDDVREVTIQSYQDAALPDGEICHFGVAGSGEAGFDHGNGVITQATKKLRMAGSQILIQQELHASARTTSSAARRAA